VFKGASLLRLAMYRDLLSTAAARRICAFDIFGKFPETTFEPDQELRRRFVESAGASSITVEEMQQLLDQKGCGENVQLIAGDITQSVPQYVAEHPELKIALLHLDVDIYEPSKVVMEHLYPRLVRGGVLILDDYGVFPGETKAVDDYFGANGPLVHRFPFAATPCYIVKE
jgi:hypothetical protein